MRNFNPFLVRGVAGVLQIYPEQLADNLFLAGPDVSEEKAERAKKKEMVLEQVEEERERRVNQGEYVARRPELVFVLQHIGFCPLPSSPASAWYLRESR